MTARREEIEYSYEGSDWLPAVTDTIANAASLLLGPKNEGNELIVRGPDGMEGRYRWSQ
jgi:hypothetical protein